MIERHSLAFRKFQIWSDCKKHGWERSAEEIGESIGIEANYVRHIVSVTGWTGRIGDPEARSAARAGGAGRRNSGHNVDENEMDVTELMRVTL